MNVIETSIPEVKIIEPKVFGDSRGCFFESHSHKNFIEKVCNTTFVQDNESHSQFGVLRGMHYQLAPYTQSKLVRVVQGKVLDVAVDMRTGSPTFGKYVAVELSAENKRQLFVPRGFAHGFLTLSEEATFLYKCDAYFVPNHEGAFKWDDPTVNIQWPIDLSRVILSEKDKTLPTFEEAIAFSYADSLY
ncbi:dTDP-4-dehydrorhamnose 3,5-epimerase [Williamwhitmania taraxaci]|uniref:dTDP-4-dehydrorhamnose 3,5-epimerase n=1 Tax=Williamwhitmania taraxaci TaxID=1640674 RepID=A0A1G6GLF2_9BACT|nr:dTDP-4-dehydrorhamnose 3,5-epimerase [Williamwhitmania taraxaci]SDB82749.1 dTDP-4-dehydrorhamnose 3,5-epimerase [Williamwhitmania taraxaci]